MITITGEFRLYKGAGIFYISPKTAEIPHIFPNFEGLTVDFALFLPKVDSDGNPVLDENLNPVYEQATVRGYRFTSSDLEEEDNQIQQTLDKLRNTVENKIAKDLKSFNPDAEIKVVKNGNKNK
jgi:hypothetical protein